MKTLLYIVGAVLILAIGIVIGVTYVWSQLAFSPDGVTVRQQTDATTTQSEGSASTPAADNPTDTDPARTPTPNNETTPYIPPVQPFTISIASLPKEQQEVIQALGFSETTFTVTPSMVSCAVEALGVARVNELRGGSAPSLAEGLSLLSCSRR